MREQKAHGAPLKLKSDAVEPTQARQQSASTTREAGKSIDAPPINRLTLDKSVNTTDNSVNKTREQMDKSVNTEAGNSVNTDRKAYRAAWMKAKRAQARATKPKGKPGRPRKPKPE
jgi:hypothetical protein